MAIEDYFKEGVENAVSRKSLCQMTGLSDRQVRQEIEDARVRGVFILNDEDGFGYYISDDVADVRRQYLRDMARIKAISKRTKHLRKYLKEKGENV